VLPVALAPGEPVQITVDYSNIIYISDPESPGYPDMDGCTLFLYLIPAGIAVDSNRDGTIEFSGEPRDTTSQDAPFRFWINDDDDGLPNSEGDVIDPPFPDYEDGVIQTARDLEDLVRLHFFFDAFQNELSEGTFKIGLKFKNIGGGYPRIKIYRSTDTEGSDSYLRDDQAAFAQVSGRDAVALGEVTDGAPMLLPQDFWSAGNTKKCLLFEAGGEGKGQLVMTVNKPDGTLVLEGPGVWLDLKNIKKMYQRAHAVPDFSDRPFDHMDNWTAPAISSEPYDIGQAFSKPKDETKEVIIYVHGINGPGGQNTAYESWQSDSETVFKRLWHQGYKGRFATFKWLALTPALPFKFNESEYRAWKCGRGLAQFVNGLPEAGGYKKNLYSFSQGAPVCGAALTVYGLGVNNYVMSQAAAPAGCYDTNPSINNYADFLNAETQRPTPDATDDLGYRGYLSSLNVSGAVISFYNTSDYALKTGNYPVIGGTNWEANEINYKPNLSDNTSYLYIPDAAVGQRCKLRYNPNPTERQVTDIHESMSFIARPRSEAAGASTAVAGTIKGRYNVGPDSPSDFRDTSSDHGGQFSRRIQRTWPYYDQILGIFTEQ
jgi:hypothetical protein